LNLSEKVLRLPPQFAQPSKLYLRTSPQSLDQPLRILREVGTSQKIDTSAQIKTWLSNGSKRDFGRAARFLL
jgi:hypothetical protein